jgi:hypothetical protein
MTFKAFYTCHTGRNVISESKTRKKPVNYRHALQALNWLLSPSDSSNETPNVITVGVEKYGLYPVHLLVIPMYICASQSLFSHSYVVNE